MDLIQKLERLFEEEFQVYHEPVQSALLQTVQSVIRDMWGTKYGSKYKNIKRDDATRLLIQPEKWKQLLKNAHDIKMFPDKIKKNSFLTGDLISQGAHHSGFTYAMDGIKDLSGKSDAIIVAKMIKAIVNDIIEINKTNSSPADKCKKLFENIEHYKYPIAAPVVLLDMYDNPNYFQEKRTQEEKPAPEVSKTGQAYKAGAVPVTP